MGMEMKMNLNLKMSQKLVMTPMLQQAIKLLPLARLELAQLVRQEIIENPVLEELLEEENDQENTSEEAEPDEEFSQDVEPSSVSQDQEIDWDSYFQGNIDKGMSVESYAEKPSIESTYKKEADLADHLMWQLDLAIDSELDKFIGSCIIGNIQNDGYLCADLNEIAEICNTEEENVQRVLSIIQNFEPLGVAARSLKECLMNQVRALPDKNPYVEILIEKYLERLEDRFLPKIASELKVDLNTVLDALRIIKDLCPKPGLLFSSERVDYVVPDLVVIKTDEGYDVVLNDDGVPNLKVSSYYHNLLKTTKEGQTKEYLEDKFRSALWLIKSIDQRRQTIYKVGKSIVKLQKAFLDDGLSYLEPMVLKDVAKDIEMHESTVSRITTNKYIDTPQGVFELKFFFHSGIKSYMGNSMSSIRVKNMIKEIINDEDGSNPLTDDQMVEALMRKNAKIARRTITKYRKELNIPPASKRKKWF
ncbi:MAG: RNA polymerase factor sigma-54 [Nitrospina sp.]|jgi:RNA polymerase sigma-54 factor|nr:RNA polymerase factor sigma-54 [Nitrospina sp.]MBT3877321.1 RNA polymerase factor sigma-54 [Nitrospina sp.]MBT4046808.1 RNA polymerase factor sigma-54 [Nitrospina sp.]MBT4557470.1 RNA polymerase factor sigma-54 [Nitrospina sp.]MBT5347389.1 RNA polymerase factor sigma-54 [Nitrospina sp.]